MFGNNGVIYLETPLRRDLKLMDLAHHPFDQHLLELRMGLEVHCWCVGKGMVAESEGGLKVVPLAARAGARRSGVMEVMDGHAG